MKKLSIVSIVKDEAPYLEEWLEYHLLQGVSHFHIYDHGSTDSTRKILDNYSEYVTWWPWQFAQLPTVNPQRAAYANALMAHGNSEDYFAFLDCDEFIIVKSELYPLDMILDSCVEGTDTAVIIANWRLFGTSGHVEKPDGLVIENFTHRQEDFNQHVKCFCIPSRVERPGNDAHTFIPKKGYTVRNSRRMIMEQNTPFHPVGDEIPAIEIAHFHTKSKEEYRARLARGRVDITEKKDFEANFPEHDRNEVQDLSLYNYTAQVKENIKNRPWNRTTKLFQVKDGVTTQVNWADIEREKRVEIDD